MKQNYKGEMNNMNVNKKIIFGLFVLAFSVMCVGPVCGQRDSPAILTSLGIANSGTNVSVSDSGATLQPTTEVGLVAYYPFDGDLVDHFGTVNNSTNHGATFVPGYKGQALCFDGLDDYVSAPVNINPDVMPQMTMSAWALSNSTSKGTVISCDAGGYDRTINIDSRGGGTGWSAFSGSKGVLGYCPVTIGDWSFVAAVYDQDAETVKLYVNGTLINEEEGMLGPGWNYTYIGSNPSHRQYFSGTIDEVRIYNRTLSTEEIKTLYEGEELSAPTSGQTSEEKVILLDENFDDGYAQEFGNEVGDWEVRFLDDQNDGEYTATTGAKRFSMAGNLTWQDYVIEANFSNAQYGGLLVHAQDQDNGILLVVCPEHNETYWHVIENGSWGTALAKVTLGHEVGDELHVKVAVSESEFEGYINGELKTTLNTSVFSSGKIGLYLFNQSDQYWDDVVVYSDGSTSTTSPPTAEVGLVAYYPFDGDFVDHFGTANNSTNHGATFVPGYKGQALCFDGLDDYVSAPVNINPDVMPQMTMIAWARSNSTSKGTVISCDAGGYDRTINIDSRGGGTGWSAFSGSKGVLGYSPVTIGDWTFVAAVYDQDAETVKLYVNGTLINEEEGMLGPGWNYTHIGSNPSHRQYFSGTIDEVRIYNRTLSTEELNALYEGEELLAPTQTPKPPSEAKVALFEADFDDGNATGFGNEVGDWEVQFLDDQNDGKYTATARTYRFSMAGDTKWQDYVIGADLSNAQDGGLLVRAQDKDNGIALIVRPTTNDIYWHARKDGRWGADLAKETLGHEAGEDLHVKVAVSGREFKAYINGEQKTTLNTAECLNGKIGLYLFYQPDQYWDDVAVYGG
ncbi:Concanavalin A-like lectin [Methanophagales archaeon]|nr:Concanavalin A-like lectin [Methanophagales archaeon]